ncbi:MAG: secondary thiamine-phosphate synthase enzyme YjbQ [Pseudomonadota bacterium]
MAVQHHAFTVSSTQKHEVLDVTGEVTRFVRETGCKNGVCTVYTPHATAAITINENDDPNIGVDLMRALGNAIPEHDGWLHDRVDDNAAAHIKAAIVGPSESIPIIDGRLALGTWQNVFLCEFDGPRANRRVLVTIVS